MEVKAPTELRLDYDGNCLDAATLRRTAAIVRDRRDVLDGLHLESRGRERLDRGLTAATRTLHTYVDTLDSEVQRFARRTFRGDRRG